MRLTVFTILFFCVIGLHAQQYKVLFLGNSYTAANNLPLLVHDLGAASGDTIVYDSETPGGFTLEGHSTYSASIQKINSQQWDYVVLQDQSQRPSFPPSQVAQQVFPYAHKLDSIIQNNNPCTETMFYMTWGRKNGDQQNCQFYPPLCTFWGMQERLYDSYTQMAVDNNAAVAPVGHAWRNMRIIDSTFNLYDADNSHPNIKGSYLTACVFYAMVTKKSPVGNSFTSSLSAADASLLQNVAHTTVFDSLHVWIGSGKSVYSFTDVNKHNDSISCSDSSFNVTNHHWDFGDGNSSTMANPSHKYLSSGNYIVHHTISNACFELTFVDSVIVLSTDMQSMQNAWLKVYPNPSTKEVHIEFVHSKIEDVELLDLQGRVVLSVEGVNQNSITLNIGEIAKGTYLLKVNTESGPQIQRIIIQ